MSKLTDGVSGFIVNIISYLNKGVVHYHKPYSDHSGTDLYFLSFMFHIFKNIQNKIIRMCCSHFSHKQFALRYGTLGTLECC